MTTSTGHGQHRDGGQEEAGDSRDSTKGLAELLQQLAMVSARVTSLREALDRDCAGGTMFAAADLNLAWSLLEVRLDVVSARHGEGVRRALRSHPAMHAIHTALRQLLSEAASYVARRTDVTAGHWPQLRQLLEDPTLQSKAIDCRLDRAFGVECTCSSRGATCKQRS